MRFKTHNLSEMARKMSDLGWNVMDDDQFGCFSLTNDEDDSYIELWDVNNPNVPTDAKFINDINDITL